MEEDNRSYHPTPAFRAFKYRRISGETQDISNVTFPEVEPSQNRRGVYRSEMPISLDLRTTNGTTNNDRKRPILGMTAVDEDIRMCSQSLVRHRNYASVDDRVNSAPRHDDDFSLGDGLGRQFQEWREEQNRIPCAKEETPSWFEESQRLLDDYQRRFHRQSLTEQAKALLDRVLEMERAGERGEKNHITDPCNSDNNSNVASIDLCTEALALCTAAIEDQEQALDRNDFIGGSYLVTGDIRLRRKGERLAAKIHCLRASISYKTGLYKESLEDCEAAISIWKQHGGGERKGYFGSSRKTAPASRSNPNSMRTNCSPKSSHKHLYLLKARVLAAMGRYREAVVWLTHPNNLPAKTFQRSSVLLETDVAMNAFLDRMLAQSCGSRGHSDSRNGNRGDSEEEKVCDVKSNAQSNAQSNTQSFQKDSPSTVANSTTREARISINRKLWSSILHRIDQRLNDGMVGTFRANSNSGERSNSANAIYQMLRHGPVLFHH